MPNLTNQSIGRYHILEQLGQGGDLMPAREILIDQVIPDKFTAGEIPVLHP